MPVPTVYADLNGDVPNMLKAAVALYGTLEGPGSRDNPVIMGWAAETGVKGFSADEVPWCGLFMAVCAKRAGWLEIPEKPLWALNWGTFGTDAGQPELGDVLTFVRPGGGHVALYVGEDREGYFHVLGGNQSNAVNIMRIRKDRMRRARRPIWKSAEPPSRKIVIRDARGAISHDEA